MRLLRLAALLGLALLASGQRAIALDLGTLAQLTDCAALGTTTTTLAIGGTFLTTVTDADVWLCAGSSCAAGGMRLPQGTVINLTISGAVSCRSTSGFGDVNFARSY